MSELHDAVPEPLPPFAATWLAQRRRGYERLERMRLEELRSMTEVDAAGVFARLDPLRPYVLRSSSGLVEQQRLFAKLRHKLGTTESDP